MHIQITKGLDIPIEGAPQGEVKALPSPKQIALHLGDFDYLRFKLLAKADDRVKIGQPLVYDKGCEERNFVSPVAGTVREVRRGLKRRLLSIVIERDEREEHLEIAPLSLKSASREEILSKLLENGLFAHIRMRPFDLLANPKQVPRDIFVKALESAPFVPPAEMQVEGYEEEFQLGLTALSKLTSGKVHLVHCAGSTCKAFKEAQDVEIHTAEGPHPISSPSVHIQKIAAIKGHNDIVWTVNAHDVVCIGLMLSKGRYHNERIISIAGQGVLPERRGYFRVRSGAPISDLLANRNTSGKLRFISGDPLMGQQVEIENFLHFHSFAFTVLPESTSRESFHFFRMGFNKFSASRAYGSGFLKHSDRKWSFTTNQHGEHRAFVDSTPYDKVTPLQIPIMQLVKAVQAEDFDRAEELGILEVAAEDFALPTFVCISKVEMVEIIKNGLQNFASELLH